MLTWSSIGARANTIQLPAGSLLTDRAVTPTWSNIGTAGYTITSNFIPGPDARNGSVRAARYQEINGAGAEALASDTTWTSATTQAYRLTVCVKAYGPTQRWILIGAASTGFVTFVQTDFNSGSGEVDSAQLNGGWSVQQNYVKRLGNGWLKYYLYFTTDVTAGAGSVILTGLGDTASNCLNGASYTGDGISGVLMWGLDIRLITGATG